MHRFTEKEIETGRSQLLEWYYTHRRELPWREPFWTPPSSITAEEATVRQVFAYHVWVSEVMLQQTQVATVIPYFAKWVSTWPTVSDLAAATLEQVHSAWAGLGFYRRATLLHKGAQAVAASPSGSLPPDVDSLKAIPGIGPYTAGAIASIALGIRAPLVDGNVIRVLARLRALGSKPSSPFFWELADALVDPQAPGDFNQSLMELGATVCTKANPKCGACPVASICLARAQVEKEKGKARTSFFGPAPSKKIKTLSPQPTKPQAEVIDLEDLAQDVGENKEPCPECAGWELEGTPTLEVTKYPRKKVKTKVRKQAIAALVITPREDDAVPESEVKPMFFMEKRPATGLLANLWQFLILPLSSMADADDTAAIADAAAERLALLSCDAVTLDKTSLARADDVKHKFSHIAQSIAVFRATTTTALSSTYLPPSSTETVWMTPSEFSSGAVSTNMKKVLRSAHPDVVGKGGKGGKGGKKKAGNPTSKRKRS